MPVPIFYEHLMIDGRKMSASLGNVVYPRDWAEVARPEALKYLYMKRIMKSRSFSWDDIPNLELEVDRAVSSGKSKLVSYSGVKGRRLVSVPIDYSTVASLVQLFKDDSALVKKASEAGLLPKKMSKNEREALFERIGHARAWVEKRASPGHKISFIERVSENELSAMDPAARKLLPAVSEKVGGKKSADEIQQAVFDVAKSNGLKPKQLFKAVYLALTGKESGPRAGLLILALGKEKCLKRFGEV